MKKVPGLDTTPRLDPRHSTFQILHLCNLGLRCIVIGVTKFVGGQQWHPARQEISI